MWELETHFSGGLGSTEAMLGLDDFKGLFHCIGELKIVSFYGLYGS